MVFESGPDFGAVVEVNISVPLALAFLLDQLFLNLADFYTINTCN